MGGNGTMLCRACKEQVDLNYTIGKTHCNSKKHRGNLAQWKEKKADDEEVKEMLEDYYEASTSSTRARYTTRCPRTRSSTATARWRRSCTLASRWPRLTIAARCCGAPGMH